MGLGRFGGGVGVTRFAAAQGAHVCVTDRATREDLAQSVARIADLDVDLRLGEHLESDFANADVVVVNPAVKPDNPLLLAALNNGATLTTEIGLLIERLPDRRRVIGITGSAGKSTVTAMVGHMLTRAGTRVHVGGNLGGSLLASLDTITGDDWVVLELSSFMLHYLAAARWSPRIAVVTSFAPNHLDWHGTADHYLASKQTLFDFQQPDDVSIGSTTVANTFVCDTYVETGEPIGLMIPGAHNQLNAAIAVATAHAALGGDAAALAEILSDFPGLPHRLERVADRDGVAFYNDSKCTTPDAAVLAIDAFPAGTVHLICGGYDKGSDLSLMARHAAAHCAGVYTIGVTGDAIADVAGTIASRCGSLDRAVQEAMRVARKGDAVVLSPGCASWDQFANYEARGEMFANLVTQA